MKIWTSEHVFDHKWETIAEAAWKKYPNPLNPAVVGTDVLNRYVDQNGVLKTHRLMTTKWGLPGWAQTLLSTDELAYGSEHSEVDPKKKTMTLKAINLTWCSIATIDEKLVYSPHPEDKSRTLLKQEAVVNVKGVPLSSYLEGIITDHINNNAQKGRQALEWVVNKIKLEAENFKTEAENFTKDQVRNVESIFSRDSSF